MHGTPEARALHARYPAIDLHADTLMWSRWIGYDLHARHEPPLPRAALGGHVDVPRMREGGMGAQFFGLVSLPLRERTRLRARHPRADRRARRADAQQDPDAPRQGADGRRHRAPPAPRRHRRAPRHRGRARARGRPRQRSTHFARRGVRYLGLLHFSANEAGFPAYGRGRRDADGLTPLGPRARASAARTTASSSTSRTSTSAASSTRARIAHEAAHREPHRRARRVRALAQHRRRAAPRGRRQGRGRWGRRRSSAATASRRW